VHGFHDGAFRMRPVPHVIEELRRLDGDVFAFVDDNIAGKHAWAKELFHAMIPLRKRWVSMASLTVGRDDELLRLARESGCLGFFVGLETLDEENLAASHKLVNRALRRDYGAAIRKMHARGLGVSAGTVYGFDRDTPAAFQTTLDFAREARLNILQVSPLTPYPGTELFARFRAEGRDLDPDWSRYDLFHPTFTPMRMTRQELQDGMARVRREFYSVQSILRRVAGNAPRLGAYSTLFNLFLNLSYRSNQRKGLHYPP
jgi:radical SAM superfamily enzyme YgiQ (UPF0313 family)